VGAAFHGDVSSETLVNAIAKYEFELAFACRRQSPCRSSRDRPPGLAVAFSEGWITPFTR
jgi:hypothetical protein